MTNKLKDLTVQKTIYYNYTTILYFIIFALWINKAKIGDTKLYNEKILLAMLFISVLVVAVQIVLKKVLIKERNILDIKILIMNTIVSSLLLALLFIEAFSIFVTIAIIYVFLYIAYFIYKKNNVKIYFLGKVQNSTEDLLEIEDLNKSHFFFKSFNLVYTILYTVNLFIFYFSLRNFGNLKSCIMFFVSIVVVLFMKKILYEISKQIMKNTISKLKKSQNKNLEEFIYKHSIGQRLNHKNTAFLKKYLEIEVKES